MSTGWVILIIVLVLGVVLGNVMLLRYSTKFKTPKSYTPPEQQKGADQKQKNNQDK